MCVYVVWYVYDVCVHCVYMWYVCVHARALLFTKQLISRFSGSLCYQEAVLMNEPQDSFIIIIIIIIIVVVVV